MDGRESIRKRWKVEETAPQRLSGVREWTFGELPEFCWSTVQPVRKVWGCDVMSEARSWRPWMACSGVRSQNQGVYVENIVLGFLNSISPPCLFHKCPRFHKNPLMTDGAQTKQPESTGVKLRRALQYLVLVLFIQGLYFLWEAGPQQDKVFSMLVARHVAFKNTPISYSYMLSHERKI